MNPKGKGGFEFNINGLIRGKPGRTAMRENTIEGFGYTHDVAHRVGMATNTRFAVEPKSAKSNPNAASDVLATHTAEISSGSVPVRPEVLAGAAGGRQSRGGRLGLVKPKKGRNMICLSVPGPAGPMVASHACSPPWGQAAAQNFTHRSNPEFRIPNLNRTPHLKRKAPGELRACATDPAWSLGIRS